MQGCSSLKIFKLEVNITAQPILVKFESLFSIINFVYNIVVLSKIYLVTHTFDHTIRNKRGMLMTMTDRPWNTRVSIRQTHMKEGGAIIWQNRRLATGYSCVSSVEPGETQYPAVYRFAAVEHSASPRSPRSRLSWRDKRSVPVKAPGLHVDLSRDSMSSVRTSPCRRILSSGSSTRRSTQRWMELYIANRCGGFTVNPCQVINYSCLWR